MSHVLDRSTGSYRPRGGTLREQLDDALAELARTQAALSDARSRNQRLVAFIESLGTPEAEAALRWQG